MSTRHVVVPPPASLARKRVRLGGHRSRGPGRAIRWSHLVLVPLALLWFFPLLWVLLVSFQTPDQAVRGGTSLVPTPPTADNFGRAWSAASFSSYTLNTILVSAGVVVLVVTVSSLAGYALSRTRLRGRKFALGALAVTMFLPKGFTIIPIFVLMERLKLTDTVLALVLTEAGSVIVVPTFLFMGFFSSVPPSMDEVARLDGCGPIRTYFSIMLPLARPAIATVAIFNFITAWNAFLIPLVMTLTNPDLRTLGVGMYVFFGESSTDTTAIAAGSLMSVLPMIIVFLFLQRHYTEGVAGAVKG